MQDRPFPTSLCCPLSQNEIMFDPVVASDGETYERDRILEHFINSKALHGKIISPRTKEEMDDRLVPNRRTKSEIEDFLTRNPGCHEHVYFSKHLISACLEALEIGNIEELSVLIAQDERLLKRPLNVGKTLIDLAQNKPHLFKWVIDEMRSHDIPLPPGIDNLLLESRIKSLEIFKNSAVTLYKNNLKSKGFQERASSILRGHTEGIFGFQLLPDGKLASGSDDQTIKIWDINKKQCLHTLQGHSDAVRGLGLLPGGQLVSSSFDKTIKVWDLDKKVCIQNLQGHSSGIASLLVLPDGRLISSAGWTSTDDCSIKIWNVDQAQCLQTLKGHTERISALQLLSSGRLASSSWDSTIKIWDIHHGQCLQTLAGHTSFAMDLVLLPNGQLISGSADCTIKVWDVSQGQCLRTLRGHTGHVISLHLLPNGYLVSGSHDGSIRVWDIKREKCLQILEGNSSTTRLHSLPNGQLISGHGTHDRTIRIWNPSHFKLELSDEDVSQLGMEISDCKLS